MMPSAAMIGRLSTLVELIKKNLAHTEKNEEAKSVEPIKNLYEGL